MEGIQYSVLRIVLATYHYSGAHPYHLEPLRIFLKSIVRGMHQFTVSLGLQHAQTTTTKQQLGL